jgi:glycosyltransferase involved in cell wall biosynthesis
MAGTCSIVIPTLNRVRTIGSAVRSALDAHPFEVIVVDCGSTDGSLDIIRAFGDRIRVIEGSFGNASSARNAGAAAAGGTYLGFLDSDDEATPMKVSCLAPYLDANDDTALVHGDIVVIDGQGNEDRDGTRIFLEQRARATKEGTRYDAIARYCVLFTSATLIRATTFRAVGGYDESIDAFEDWDLYLRLSLESRIVYASCNSARYRRWEGNVPWDTTATGLISVARKHLTNMDQVPEEMRGQARRSFLIKLAASHHTLLEQERAREASLRAVRDSPTAIFDPRILRALALSWVPQWLLERRRGKRSLRSIQPG